MASPSGCGVCVAPATASPTKNTPQNPGEYKGAEYTKGYFPSGGDGSCISHDTFGRIQHDPEALNVPVHKVLIGRNKMSKADRDREEREGMETDVKELDGWVPAKPLF